MPVQAWRPQRPASWLPLLLGRLSSKCCDQQFWLRLRQKLTPLFFGEERRFQWTMAWRSVETKLLLDFWLTPVLPFGSSSEANSRASQFCSTAARTTSLLARSSWKKHSHRSGQYSRWKSSPILCTLNPKHPLARNAPLTVQYLSTIVARLTARNASGTATWAWKEPIPAFDSRSCMGKEVPMENGVEICRN